MMSIYNAAALIYMLDHHNLSTFDSDNAKVDDEVLVIHQFENQQTLLFATSMSNTNSKSLNSTRLGWKKSQKFRFVVKSLVILLGVYSVGKLLLGSSSSDDVDNKPRYDGASRIKRLNQLQTWAISKGARVNEQVEIKRDDGDAGFGFFALQNLKVHEEICVVPGKLIILPDKDGSPVFNLVRYLIAARKEPYVASLPWEDMDTLKLTTDYEMAINQAIEGSDDEIVDVNTFKRAFMLVISRVHRVGDHPFALVPLCDMFNTPSSNTRNMANVECAWIRNENNLKGSAYSCRTTMPVKVGDPLLVAYRDQSGQQVDNHMLSKQWGIIS